MPEGTDISQSRRQYVELFLERPLFHLTGIDLKVFSAMGDEGCRNCVELV